MELTISCLFYCVISFVFFKLFLLFLLYPLFVDSVSKNMDV